MDVLFPDLLLDQDGFLDRGEVAHGCRRENRRRSRVFELGRASFRYVIMLARNFSGLSPFGKPTSLGGNSLYA